MQLLSQSGHVQLKSNAVLLLRFTSYVAGIFDNQETVIIHLAFKCFQEGKHDFSE